MRRMILFLSLFLGVCCTTVERIGDEPSVFIQQPTPWLCSVEIESYFRIPEDGKMVKPSTLLMRKADTKIVMARGTGTVIGRDGDVLRILTAKHVVFGAKDFWVKIDDITVQGFGAKHSPTNDVSIFYVKSAKLAAHRMVAPLASKVPAPGAQLDLVGNALGLGLKHMASGPMGGDEPVIVHEMVVWEGSYHSYPGCSGGGIWHDGKLVGVVSMVVVFRTIDGRAIPQADMGLFVGAESVLPLLRK